MATLSEKIILFSDLLTGEKARLGPFIAFMEPTQRCNLSCLCCRYHSSQFPGPSSAEGQKLHDLPSSLAARYIDDLKAMGTRSLYFCGGGEPFLHPHLFDFVAHANRLGLHVKVVTNGTLLTETRINAMLDCPPDQLRVSLLASTPAEYAKHYPGTNPKFFIRVAEGLRLLAAKKAQRGQKLPEVVLKRVITRHNYQNLGALVDLALETKVSRLEFSPMRTWRGRIAEAALTPEEEREVLRTLRHLNAQRPDLLPKDYLNRTLTRYRLGEAVREKLPCYRGWLLTDLRADGTIRACSSFTQAMGTLHENSLPVIWNGPQYREFRRQNRTLRSLAAQGDEYDCGFCGFVHENLKVHRLFRWFAFLARHRAGPFQGRSQASPTRDFT